MEFWGHSGSLGYSGLHIQYLGHALVVIPIDRRNSKR